jgi:Homeodomain-like domain
VARQPMHRWMSRYRAEGIGGLAERSHAPKRHPWQIPAQVEAVICELRRAHRRWGPRRLVFERGAVAIRACRGPRSTGSWSVISRSSRCRYFSGTMKYVLISLADIAIASTSSSVSFRSGLMMTSTAFCLNGVFDMRLKPLSFIRYRATVFPA